MSAFECQPKELSLYYVEGKAMNGFWVLAGEGMT